MLAGGRVVGMPANAVGREQMQRMEDMNCEVVPFEDVLCQM